GVRQARSLSRHSLQRRRGRGACDQYGLQARDAVERKRIDDDLRQAAGRADPQGFRRQGVTCFSLAPRLRGEGWGEGPLSANAVVTFDIIRPSPGLLRSPTSPRKERGEVKAERQETTPWPQHRSFDCIPMMAC